MEGGKGGGWLKLTKMYFAIYMWLLPFLYYKVENEPAKADISAKLQPVLCVVQEMEQFQKAWLPPLSTCILFRALLDFLLKFASPTHPFLTK